MIQELLGDAAAASGLILGSSGSGERKISIAETLILHSSPDSPCTPNSCSPSFPFPITTTVTAAATKTTSNLTATTTMPTATTTTTNSEAQNLKCPRCNSTNTKFCYYNNYNLTQPRHFCKGCRRYWTKGGALRNVPVGGGCRKNKITSCLSSSTAGKSSVTKVRMNLPLTEFGWQGVIGNGNHRDLASSQMFWPSPQDSHILALLRAARNPDPLPNLSSAFAIKREGLVMGSEDLGMTSPSSVVPGGFLSYNNGPHSYVSCSSSFMKNSHDQQHHRGLVHKEAQSLKVQLIRSKSSDGCGLDDHPSASVLSSNFVSNSSSSGALSAIFESTPVVTRGGDFINP